MEPRIILSGLCSFLNPDGANPRMPEPSVILVQTRRHPEMPDHPPNGTGSTPHPGGIRIQSDIRVDGSICDQDEVRVRTEVLFKTKGGGPSAPPPGTSMSMPMPCQGIPPQKHVAFLAFDTREISVDDPGGFLTDDDAPDFRYLPLEGYEIVIEDNTPGIPTVMPRYHEFVPKRKDYWPESQQDVFDPAYVPPPGGGKPAKSAVDAYMQFGAGDIDVGRVGIYMSQFRKSDGSVARRGTFAEEVIYNLLPVRTRHLVITLKDLDTGVQLRTLDFFLWRDDLSILTLFVGNHLAEDIDIVLRQEAFPQPAHGCHFAFLNAVAGQGFGPVPVPEMPVEPGSGGGSGALCGPGHANG